MLLALVPVVSTAMLLASCFLWFGFFFTVFFVLFPVFNIYCPSTDNTTRHCRKHITMSEPAWHKSLYKVSLPSVPTGCFSSCGQQLFPGKAECSTGHIFAFDHHLWNQSNSSIRTLTSKQGESSKHLLIWSSLKDQDFPNMRKEKQQLPLQFWVLLWERKQEERSSLVMS